MAKALTQFAPLTRVIWQFLSRGHVHFPTIKSEVQQLRYIFYAETLFLVFPRFFVASPSRTYCKIANNLSFARTFLLIIRYVGAKFLLHLAIHRPQRSFAMLSEAKQRKSVIAGVGYLVLLDNG